MVDAEDGPFASPTAASRLPDHVPMGAGAPQQRSSRPSLRNILRKKGRMEIPPHVARFIIKFGPIILVISLLFAVKYFLIAIHMNLHALKHNMKLQQCAEETSNRDSHGLASAGLDESLERWRQYRMVGRGAYSYVQFSAYRTSEKDIVAVGFGAVVMKKHRVINTCTWHGANGQTIDGKITVRHPENRTSFQYETLVLSCSLPTPISSSSGGHLVATIDREHVLLYREDKVLATSISASLSSRLPFSSSMCTFPVYDAVDGDRLKEWLIIHKHIGIQHVIGYDAGGMDPLAANHVAEYVADGFLEITPMRDVALFDVYGHGVIASMHDCLFRSVLTSTWVIYNDWDDLFRVDPPKTLQALLQEHEEVPWMSRGARWWGVDHCTPPLKVPRGRAKQLHLAPFPQERMVFHWPHFFCSDAGEVVDNNMCPAGRGHRYVIANPHKVTLMEKNDVLEPREGGVDLDANQVRHEHFDNLHKKSNASNICKDIHQFVEPLEWWSKGTEIKDMVEEARMAAL